MRLHGWFKLAWAVQACTGGTKLNGWYGTSVERPKKHKAGVSNYLLSNGMMLSVTTMRPKGPNKLHGGSMGRTIAKQSRRFYLAFQQRHDAVSYYHRDQRGPANCMGRTPEKQSEVGVSFSSCMTHGGSIGRTPEKNKQTRCFVCILCDRNTKRSNRFCMDGCCTGRILLPPSP